MCIYNGIYFRFNSFLPYKALHKLYMPPLSNISLSNVLNVFRSYSYCKNNYAIEIEAALNKQIGSEQNAAFAYLNMAVYFLHSNVSYPGVGGYFMKMYEEELGHMKLLINHQLIRGGNPKFKFDEVKPIIPNLTLLDAFNHALDVEKKVTEQLENIVKLAETKEDYETADYIGSKFLNEQMLAVNELSQYITILKRLCDDNHALYQFDLKLSQIYPYSMKT